MKAIALLMGFLGLFSLTSADTPESIYLRIDPVIGDSSPLSEAGIIGGCYIGYDKECSGLFYIDEDGSGIIMGTIIYDAHPTFELLYSITLTNENGRDLLVGSAYAMEFSPEGEILSGRRTEIRQPINLGEEVVLAQPVGQLPNGKPVFLQMSTDIWSLKQGDKSVKHPITLISTQLADGELYSQVTNWYGSVQNEYAFRTKFRSKEKNGKYELLHYQVEIKVNYEEGSDILSRTGAVSQPVKARLIFNRRYTIDTLNYPHASFTPDVTYVSEYRKDVDLIPGKMLKIIFPPDTPSVRGFDIEDTLIIVPQ
jgi:archaellum component FlaF (FlaF/FlaG flagellin family)